MPKTKLILSLLFWVLSLGITKAQSYGNEWIQYNQQYFVIDITEEGMYRIHYNTLLNAGVPLGSFDPRGIQIFARGEELPLFVKNESSGNFLPGDYIEFYAYGNDGWFDAGFYEQAEHQPNTHHSLINDTISYYLTWNNSINNKRYAVSTQNNFSGFTPLPYFLYTSREDYTSHYYAGETNNYGVTQPGYGRAEGWFDSAMSLGQSRTKNIPTPNIVNSGPQAEIEFGVAGASNFRPNNPDHHLRIVFAGNSIDTLYKGYQFIRIQRNVNASALNANGTSFTFSSINSLGSTVDRSAIAYVQVRYPHSFNMREQAFMRFHTPQSANSQNLLSFSHLDAMEQDTVWVYNQDPAIKARAFFQNNSWKAIIPENGQINQWKVSVSSSVKTVPQIRPVSSPGAAFAQFRNFASQPHRSSDYLMISHELLWNEAEAYKSYRNATDYTVLLVDVEELYHQFSYGIRKHPLALRNFAHFALDQFDEEVKKLFLLGKARGAPQYRNNSGVYAQTLVPSYGNPASDNLITAGLRGGLYTPALGTGRLAARNSGHVSLYLNKVMQYEAIQNQPEEWMKKILHFGGGSSINEQNILAGYLRQYENTLKDTLWGGSVMTFLKSSTEPIQINQSDSLRRLINNGVAIMTFFGHASGTGFDISIDHPSEYQNFGKYPFMFANSCFAGDIFGAGTSSSENFVLIEEKGVIGYLAGTSAMGSFELNLFSNELFRNISYKNYNGAMGESIRRSIAKIESPNIYIRNACLLKTLHGDPALRIYSQPKPDYTLSSEDIFFSPEIITSELDSFYVHVVSTNIGKAIRDSMIIEIQRVFSNSDTETLQRRVPASLFKDTISFGFAIDRERGPGINTFTITLDALNEIDELTISNNIASNEVLIRSTDIIPVLPAKYAIVPKNQLTLKASTGDPFAPKRNYEFQISENPNFEQHISQQMESAGGVLSWTPPINLTDSTVYYWRTSPVPKEGDDYNWRGSSFQHIQNQKGWSQASFEQFKNNQYVFVRPNLEENHFEFVNNLNSITAQTGYYPYLPWDEQYIRINNVNVEVFSCLQHNGHGMYFAVFDPISAEHWITINQGDGLGEYENRHCRTRPHGTFDYHATSELWRDRMRRFIDTIPDGHYVLAASHRNHNAENYEEELYEAFERLGSANIRDLQNNTPYLLYGIKGSEPGTANEVIGGSITSVIQLADSLITKWTEGSITSEKIGPASQWHELFWKQESFDGLDTDSVWLNVYGINRFGESQALIHDIQPEENYIDLSMHNISAQEYPYLQLQVKMMDDENRTPAQMKYWKITYEGVAETSLDASKHFVFEADTLQEGQKLIFSTAIHNIGEYDMDSLLVSYWVLDQNRKLHPIEYPRQRPHPSGDVLIDTITFNTHGFRGHNSIWVEVNPLQDQIEQQHFNNVGQLHFFVERDRKNPLLEVTFDGIQIMNGDLISAEPHIMISVKDENPYLELNDTTMVNVFLTTPSQPEFQRIHFQQNGQQNLVFHPGTSQDNTAQIEYFPKLTEDGVYTLKVQAKDRSGNESGAYDYEISFEVINRSTITEILNWPNPFSTATHFVFTLTGSQLPDFMKIQVLTISGKVVREIDMSELGPIRVGRNITQYAWDGTDQFGDRLANGVYLYRVITNIDGEAIELNPTSASDYFHKGFGKMYLIR